MASEGGGTSHLNLPGHAYPLCLSSSRRSGKNGIVGFPTPRSENCSQLSKSSIHSYPFSPLFHLPLFSLSLTFHSRPCERAQRDSRLHSRLYEISTCLAFHFFGRVGDRESQRRKGESEREGKGRGGKREGEEGRGEEEKREERKNSAESPKSRTCSRAPTAPPHWDKSRDTPSARLRHVDSFPNSLPSEGCGPIDSS